jgi:hypothetical protein
MGKNVRVILSSDATEVYKHLNEEAEHSKIDNSILNAINNKIELIKANFHYGYPIAKDIIPEEYKEKYGITNLFWVELPSFWRMLYTLKDGENEIEIIAFVLDIVNHNEYDKKFGYKKK